MVPEVQLGVVVGVSEGEVSVSSGDVVFDRPSSASTPSRVESEPLSSLSPSVQVPSQGTVVPTVVVDHVPSSDTVAPTEVVRGEVVARSRRGRPRRSSGNLRVPMLEGEVKQLLESQVGKFTHALCVPLRDPVYVDPDDTSQAIPAVKSAPGERDHVLCLGTQVGHAVNQTAACFPSCAS